RGYVKDGLYHFTSTFSQSLVQALSTASGSSDICHQRIGHCSSPVLSSSSIVISNKETHVVCAPCQLAKSRRQPLYTSEFTSVAPLD
ncbi:UNVERIFIED_CONTAM: GAG-pre-integrase domain-containing protein, partial [Salmonella enterica subsp. enterica serovar Weltevreden]